MTVSNQDCDITVRALIDTGAPSTIFTRSVAEAIALDLRSPEFPTVGHHLAGQLRTAKHAFVHLTLPPFEDLSWDAEVAFLLDEWEMPFAGLLGHDGFLLRWVVSFNSYGNYMVVEPPDSFAERTPVGREDQEVWSNPSYDSEWDRPTRW